MVMKRYAAQHAGAARLPAPKRPRRGAGRLLFMLLNLFFAALLFVSAVAIAEHLMESERDKRRFMELSAAAEACGGVADAPDPQAAATAEPPRPETPQRTQYASLYEENSDFAGWLRIDGTGIDYPVMFTPEEPEYYLRRAFDRSRSTGGTPFIGEGGTIDSDFYIIHGHNMKNDAMFGTLERYAERAFWAEHPVISVTTVTEEREYEIFAAVRTRVLYQDEAGYRYYSQAGALTGEAFDELTGWLRQNAFYDTGIVPAYGEQIVVLSTCSSHTDNGRFLVAARRSDSRT